MVNVFHNPKPIQSICHVPEAMKVHYNAGICITKLIGDLPGYRVVWLDPEAIANILSLKLVEKKYHIAYDSKENCRFVSTTLGKYFSSSNLSLGLIFWTPSPLIQINHSMKMSLL